MAEKENLKDFNIKHDYKPNPYDGKRQIDIWCEYTALGSKQIIICECKKTKRKIEIGAVEKLCARLDSLGAQRGYVFSTAGFQRGAIQYAKEHRIVLIQVLNKYAKFISNSVQNIDNQMAQFKEEYYKRLPDYCLIKIDDGDGNAFEQIYPTENMEHIIMDEITKMIEARKSKR